MRHGDIDYIEIDMATCETRGLALHAAGHAWHTHVLSPGCRYNPYPGRYAIVVEDDVEHIAWIAASDGFPELDKRFVRLLHGDDILDAAKTGGGTGEDTPLLARVRALDAAGAPWHHHMNFPGCVFNPAPGRWAISVESGDGDLDHESYEAEPTDVLREIEVLYFRRLDD